MKEEEGKEGGVLLNKRRKEGGSIFNISVRPICWEIRSGHVMELK
jgi:hypothetical protein